MLGQGIELRYPIYKDEEQLLLTVARLVFGADALDAVARL